MLKRLRNVPVKIEGVCEGVSGPNSRNQTLLPGLIWASGENSISFIETAATNAVVPETDRSPQSIPATNPALQGFYGMRGVVTFNDRVFDKDYIFVQEDATVVLVALENRSLNSRLKVGQWVDLGGALEAGRYVPTITPLAVKELGWHPMPLPIAQPLASPAPANQEGRWTELAGVVHSINSNGTLSIVGTDGPAYLWIGQTPSNCLASFVDARLRVRGVLLLTLLDAPVLLAPSRNFVDVEEDPPGDPFSAPRRSIAGLFSEATNPSYSHRARVAGEVTYHDARSFFIQDGSGGVRVRTSDQPTVRPGETVEVLGFPTVNGFVRSVTEALVRPAKGVEHVRSKNLDLSQTVSPDQSGTLVQVSATLLARKTNAMTQVLELQDQQRVFIATLPASQGRLRDMLPGSRLRITGVCDDETTAASPEGGQPTKAQLPTSLRILLRSPQDVAVLSGPPWWTLRRTVILVVTLLTVILGSLLWVHLLQRRLERQRAARLAFSRHVLERLEDERRQIAANLHDSLGQILLAIKNQALLAIQRPPDERGLRQRLDDISGATSQAIEEVRQITHGLRPYQLDRLGLTQAIRASVNRAAANSSISFATRVEDIDGLFDQDTEIHVYRVVQEAVTNVVKHSAATEAAVVIKKRTATVTISIRDNGHGFDPAKRFSEPPDLGYGLSGIDERVRILGGTLTIDSRPGEGTNLMVEISVPIPSHDPGSNSVDRG
jgi:signal transduction histidine kinase